MLKIKTARDSVFTDRTDVYQLLYVREQTSYSVDDPINSGNDTEHIFMSKRDNRASRQLCEICHEECKLPVDGSEAIWLYLHSAWCPHTCGAGDGKLTPSSFRVFIVELRRLSCGSFWKSSAHSTISAFSFSHTLEWAYSTKMKNEDPLFCSQKETVSPQSLKKHLTHKWCTEIEIN